MKILIINSGSTSIKFQIFKMDNEQTICKGLVDRVGNNSVIKIETSVFKKEFNINVENHKQGLETVLNLLTSDDTGILKDISEIDAVGHRLVHGGDKLTRPMLITPEVVSVVEDNLNLAPLHNPPGLLGVQAITALLPELPQCASFDTAYYSDMSQAAFSFGLGYEYYEKYGLRKFGFHGASHKYINLRAAEMLGLPKEKLHTVSAHIGGGVSLTSSIGCRAVDTSLGLGTACGVPMGTRAGDVDPDAVLHLITEAGFSAAEVKDIIYKKSGLAGISGVSPDLRDILKAADEGQERSVLALEIFVRSIRKYIGKLACTLDGRMDALIFTAGIGENSAVIREKICSGLEVLGIEIDSELNDSAAGVESVISSSQSKVKVLVIPTNEEWMMASETKEVLENLE